MPLRLLRQAQEHDVFHIHCCSGWGFFPAILGISIGGFLRKRIVLTYHGGGADAFFSKHTRLVKKWLSRTTFNIVLSGYTGNVFDKYGIPKVIIPNIIEFDPSYYRERSLFQPYFICVRSHEPLYNIPCIIHAFKIVQEKFPEASLTLVGDGSQHEELVALVKELGLKNVLFPGRVENSKIYEFLDKADIMLSSPIIDNMPVSLLEAMNAGLLVISSCVGGVPFLIEDKKTGLLFASNDYSELANLMINALIYSECSKMITKKAKETVTKYSWEVIKESICGIYHSCQN